MDFIHKAMTDWYSLGLSIGKQATLERLEELIQAIAEEMSRDYDFTEVLKSLERGAMQSTYGMEVVK